MRLQQQLKHLSARSVVALIGLGIASAALAAPITITAPNIWRADRTANPLGFAPTAIVPWVSVNTDPSGNAADTVVTASIGETSYTLRRIATGLFSGIYWTEIPYDTTLTGNWTITASNGPNISTAMRPGFVPVNAMPFVSSIGFTGTGNDITVNWTLTSEAAARLDEQQVTIWDMSGPAPLTVQFFPIGVAARSVDLTPLSLTLGRQYAVEINSVDRNAQTRFIDAFSGNWLVGWTPTTGLVQVPTPSSLALLGAGLWLLLVGRRGTVARARRHAR